MFTSLQRRTQAGECVSKVGEIQAALRGLEHDRSWLVGRSLTRSRGAAKRALVADVENLRALATSREVSSVAVGQRLEGSAENLLALWCFLSQAAHQATNLPGQLR